MTGRKLPENSALGTREARRVSQRRIWRLVCLRRTSAFVGLRRDKSARQVGSTSKMPVLRFLGSFYTNDTNFRESEVVSAPFAYALLFPPFAGSVITWVSIGDSAV